MDLPLEQVERMPGRVEHDPDSLPRLDVGEDRTGAKSPPDRFV